MNRSLACLLILAAAAWPAEDEAYKNLAAAQRRNEAALVPQARAFLEAFPKSARAATVHLWIAERLAATEPREALAHYRESGLPDARRGAADLLFRHEAPPPLAVDRWIGTPIDPCASPGEVKAIVFFSLTHPQTRRLVPRLEAMQARGVRLAGVAAVVDDHRSQRPDVLLRKLRACKLPFPVAVDRQRPQAMSTSLERYRGRSVPWAVLIDRYGRIAWLGGIDPQANTMARFEGAATELLAQPSYETLKARGELKTLAKIRTVNTAAVLVGALKDPGLKARRGEILTILRGLMPEGYLGGDPVAAVSRWKRDRAHVRYSFPRNRLVRR